jgi:hypothetical protein
MNDFLLYGCNLFTANAVMNELHHHTFTTGTPSIQKARQLISQTFLRELWHGI